jgi:hypothetical protein
MVSAVDQIGRHQGGAFTAHPASKENRPGCDPEAAITNFDL